MSFLQAIASGFRNGVNFRGRASRSEYWYWMLFILLGTIVAGIMDDVILGLQSGIIGGIFSLGTLLPMLAIEIRRLHDVDRTGWWMLIDITIIGMLFPRLYWKCKKGTEGPNRFGPDPLGMDYAVSVFE